MSIVGMLRREELVETVLGARDRPGEARTALGVSELLAYDRSEIVRLLAGGLG